MKSDFMLFGNNRKLEDIKLENGVTLTPIVVTHANIVANHVSHSAGKQVWLVRVNVHTYTHRFACANCLWHGHTSLATLEYFSAANITELCDISVVLEPSHQS